MTGITKVCIANRGEIAARIMYSCRSLNISTLWPYCYEDEKSLAAQLADEKVTIEKPQDYLDITKIVSLAQENNCDAIHPGYGYLSENADFAKAVIEAGLIFIGPSPEAITVMGDKLKARKCMGEAGVGIVPGGTVASEVGFPLIIKAAAGGGGKGMRIVKETSDLDEALASCRSESLKAFASDDIYMERYLPEARHIEVQILADSHGQITSYGCRDCSLQRRHQKILEECPPFGYDEEFLKCIEAAALQVAKAVNYVGAGTVEFLVTSDKEFFFLEMNTRLQVEHPVTEMVYAVDLVEEQIKIAEGLKLSTQTNTANGHAFEARIYAEDSSNEFFPCIGKIHMLELPSGPGIRVDTGVIEGSTIGLDFDPMMLKIIAHGPHRESARQRLKMALEDFVLHGVGHNGGFLLDILDHDDCVEAKIHTSWLDRHSFEQSVPKDSHVLALLESEDIKIKGNEVEASYQDSAYLQGKAFYLS